MKRITALLFCLLLSSANAQMNTGMDHAVSSSTYVGPGDKVPGAIAWWGLRAYNAAWATAHNKLANVCTPSDASCQDVPSDSGGNFNLGATSLTCNNSGSICTVKTLYDQSGASSCTGACDVTNATIANRPTLVVPGAANGCSTTSNYCMSTTGGGAQSLVNSTGFSSGSAQPYTISVVFNNPSRTGDEYLFSSSNFNQPLLISGSGGANHFSIQAFGGTTVTLTSGVTDGSYYAIQSVFNNNTSDINVNGSANPENVGTSIAFTTIDPVLLNFTGPTGGANSFGGFTEEWGMWGSGTTWTTTTSSNMSANQRGYWNF